jgi:cation transport ATPase
MRRDSIRLSRRHKFALYTAIVAVFGTGVVWTWLHYFTAHASEFGSSPGESWMLKLHGGFAMATLLMLGTLLPLHVKFAWAAHRNRPNGITLLTVFGTLILTGYGLYYIGSDRLRSWTSTIHLLIGLALPLFIVVHIWRGRVTRRSKQNVLPKNPANPARSTSSSVSAQEVR